MQSSPNAIIIKPGILGVAGRLLCWLTGALLLYLPYFYLGIATEGGGFNAVRLSPFHYAIIVVQLVLAIMFLLPSMSEKYLRSGHSVARILGVRLLLLAVFCLIMAEVLLISYRDFAPLPEFITRFGPEKMLVALSGWIFFYLTLMLLPGSYIRFLYFAHLAKKLDFPMPVVMKMKRGKAVLYIPDPKDSQTIQTFVLGFKQGLPNFTPIKNPDTPWALGLILAPITGLFFAVMLGSFRGNFLAAEPLLVIYQQYYLPVLGGITALFLLMAYLQKETAIQSILPMALVVVFLALYGLPSAMQRGAPLALGFLAGKGQAQAREYQVLPQPPWFERLMAGYCLNPLRVADRAAPQVPLYLCGLRVRRSAPPREGTVFSLQGQQGEYGFWHARELEIVSAQR